MIKPFPKISEKTLYRGEYRNLLGKTFQLPDGKTNSYEVITARNPYGAVIILAINSKNEVLVNHEFRVGPEIIMLDLPSGAIEKDEDMKQAAARELLEETGYATTLSDLEYLGGATPDAYSDIKWHFFLTKKVTKTPNQKLDSTEFIETDWIPIHELIKKAKSGKMCASYAMAFFMAWDKLKR